MITKTESGNNKANLLLNNYNSEEILKSPNFKSLDCLLLLWLVTFPSSKSCSQWQAVSKLHQQNPAQTSPSLPVPQNFFHLLVSFFFFLFLAVDNISYLIKWLVNPPCITYFWLAIVDIWAKGRQWWEDANNANLYCFFRPFCRSWIPTADLKSVVEVCSSLGL